MTFRPTGRQTQTSKLSRQLRKQSTHHSATTKDDTVAGSSKPDREVDRRMVWVDSVGGFLLCLDNEVTLGQPVGETSSGPTVPILADISRRHAVLRREAGSYVLEPLGPTFVDGQPITGPMVLTGECTIGLGESVRLRFEKPHALSLTARLTVISGHRTTPSADSVLLMADSCVLGAESHCHVRCRGWKENVILYRQAGEIYCRSKRPLRANDSPASEAVRLSENCRVEGQDFSMFVELA